MFIAATSPGYYFNLIISTNGKLFVPRKIIELKEYIVVTLCTVLDSYYKICT